MENIITINNATLYEFYTTYRIDPETINIHFMNILKPILDTKDTLGINQTSFIMEKLSNLTNKIEHINTNISIQLQNTNEKYMELFKGIIKSNHVDCMLPLIRDATETLIAKTSDIIQQTSTQHNSQEIDGHLSQIRDIIQQETNKLTTSAMDKTSIDLFLSTIHSTISNISTNISTNIIGFETRMENKLGENERKLQDMYISFRETDNTQKELSSRVSDILKKFEKSSDKGIISENITYNLLLELFPTAQIDQVGNEKETCDIRITRMNKPTILIENKDHETKNVTKQEVDKFIRDCNIQNCCGIMLAQHKGIANKHNFELQINGNNVLLYVHRVEFNPEIIKLAIDAVENYKITLDNHYKIAENTITLDINTLNEINYEFKQYASQKTLILKLLKDNNDKMTEALNAMKMPSIERLLSTKFASSNSISSSSLNNVSATSSTYSEQELICQYCGDGIKRSIKGHQRFCKQYKELKTQLNSDNDSQDENSIISESNHTLNKYKKSKSKKK